uniref:Uncharacterized protein n=1 Tax=Magallana gigas TaxID=29159 RepID=A0A8W8LWU0_MAGGI
MIVTCHLAFYSLKWAYGYLSSRFMAGAEKYNVPPSQPPPPPLPASLIINPWNPASSVDPHLLELLVGDDSGSGYHPPEFALLLYKTWSRPELIKVFYKKLVTFKNMMAFKLEVKGVLVIMSLGSNLNIVE